MPKFCDECGSPIIRHSDVGRTIMLECDCSIICKVKKVWKL